MTVCAHRWVWNVWTVCGIHINKFRWSDNFSVYVAYAFGRCMAALTLYGSLFFVSSQLGRPMKMTRHIPRSLNERFGLMQVKNSAFEKKHLCWILYTHLFYISL